MPPVIGSALLLAGIYGAQRRLIYFPDNNLPHPAAVGLPGVVGRIQTDDGLSLIVWYAPPAGAGDFVVLYLHGNGGNIAYRARRILGFAELGWGVMLPEYRGYGGNPGTPSEKGLLLDARAAYARLVSMGTAPERILLWESRVAPDWRCICRRARGGVPAAGVAVYQHDGSRALAYAVAAGAGSLLRDRFDSLRRIGCGDAPPFW